MSKRKVVCLVAVTLVLCTVFTSCKLLQGSKFKLAKEEKEIDRAYDMYAKAADKMNDAAEMSMTMKDESKEIGSDANPGSSHALALPSSQVKVSYIKNADKSDIEMLMESGDGSVQYYKDGYIYQGAEDTKIKTAFPADKAIEWSKGQGVAFSKNSVTDFSLDKKSDGKVNLSFDIKDYTDPAGASYPKAKVEAEIDKNGDFISFSVSYEQTVTMMTAEVDVRHTTSFTDIKFSGVEITPPENLEAYIEA